MAQFYTRSLMKQVKTIEKNTNLKGETVLFIDLNSNGTYGEKEFTEKELDEYVKLKNYSVVIIDDIL